VIAEIDVRGWLIKQNDLTRVHVPVQISKNGSIVVLEGGSSDTESRLLTVAQMMIIALYRSVCRGQRARDQYVTAGSLLSGSARYLAAAPVA
jgi:hypothetical protein